MLIDLHTHTYPKSDDSQLSPADLVLKAKKAGLDGICLTEHDWFWSTEEIAQINREMDFLLLPGVEMNTEDGHMIVFGITEFVFGVHHTDFLRDLVTKKNGFMILAHPFRRRFYEHDNIEKKVDQFLQDPVLKMVDTIETMNGRGKDRQNQFSMALGEKLGWQGIGGSDAHYARNIPSCATRFQKKYVILTS